ncbi:hypothetical protein WJ32_11475 [Burkholderia ubonensis]|uniref:Short-chain dehydrogenase n=1 Tax=Burkholderia ubonensis TaxID=101571 RepID=A0A124RD13_9BURK|nr:hypothetical protein WJ32_11475 [Burkholderia ubonensis]KVG72589.1 hypothetical protein WJ33_18835 [Burkholderia ubonensis]
MTGTSGIGRALAEVFSRRGNKVIVAGRPLRDDAAPNEHAFVDQFSQFGALQMLANLSLQLGTHL